MSDLQFCSAFCVDNFCRIALSNGVVIVRLSKRMDGALSQQNRQVCFIECLNAYRA